MEVEVGGMVGDLKRLLQALREVSGRLVSLLGRMNLEVTQLSEDIENAVGGITVHVMLDQQLSQLVDALMGVVAETRAIVPVAGKAQSERLREIAQRYTMHSERKIHAAFSGGAVDRKATPVTAASAEGDLGDNVELF